jgi:sigma-B regulation protein RsbU (phosphoserine phosphatase)
MMSSLQARVHMLAESSPDPAPAVTTLNRNLAARCPLGKFITFYYGVLDPSNGRLYYANAGHNYPVIIRQNGTFELLLGNGMVLGIIGISKYDPYEAQLGPGDMLALFSDGVTEARSRDGREEFGDQRLGEFLSERRAKPLDAIIQELVDYLKDWSGQPGFADDFTMLLARRSIDAFDEVATQVVRLPGE